MNRMTSAASTIILASALVPAAPAQPQRPTIDRPQRANLVELLLGPQAVTSEVTALEDQWTTLALSGVDPLDPAANLTLHITRLPDAGQLRQMDGTPIMTVPTEITGARGRIEFRGPPDACTFAGRPALTEFSYRVTNEAGGQASRRQDVSVFVTPVYDPVPNLPDLLAVEDEPLYIHLPPSPEGRWYVTYAFDDFVHVFQVEADGVTPGELILADHAPAPVTNAAGLIVAIPQPNIFGDTMGYIEVGHTLDQWPDLPVYQHDVRFDIDVAPVNDPPNIADETWPMANDQLRLHVQLHGNDFTDRDPYGNVQWDHLTFTITRLPEHGKLYAGVNDIRPETEVSLNADFSIFERDFTYVRPPETLWQWADPWDSFDVSLSDGALSSAATWHIPGYYRNLPPAIVDLEPQVELEQDTEGWIVFNISDDQFGALLDIVQLPAHGTLFWAEPQFQGGFEFYPITDLGTLYRWPIECCYRLVYVPDPGYSNTADAPDALVLRVQDALGAYAPDPTLPVNPDGSYTPLDYTVNLIVTPPAKGR